MNLDYFITIGRNFFYTHTIIAVSIIVAIAIFACFKPKAMLKLGIFGLVMGVLFYIISLLGGTLSTGVKHTDTLTDRSQDANELPNRR